MTLSPLKRRLIYVTAFEIIAIILSTLILMKLSHSDASESLPIAVMMSVAAVGTLYIIPLLKRGNVAGVLYVVHYGYAVLMLLVLKVGWY